MQVIPEFGLGGAETMCANLSIELRKMGHSVMVVSLYNLQSTITEKLINNDVKVIYLHKKPGLNLSIIFDLYKIIKQEKPDVVHSHLYAAKYAHAASILSRVRVKVHTIHNIASKDGGTLEQVVNRFLFKICGVIPVSLSNDVKKTVVDVYKIGEQRSPVILNGVPLDECCPIVKYKPYATKFLHVGRFSEQKNHILLIKAFAEAHKSANQIELYLYGDGILKSDCRELVQKLKATNYIHFCGTTDNVYSVMNDMDAFILPSLWEGVPMTLIEAMGTGLPILASAVGGIPDMINDGENGILIHPIQQDITKGILTIYDNYYLRKKLGQNAIKTSVHFSAHKMAEKYLEVYSTKLRKDKQKNNCC